MITTKDVQGPQYAPGEQDTTILHLIASNGVEAKYSLSALGLSQIPESVTLHGRVYKRDGDSKVFNEASDEPVRPVREASKEMRLPVRAEATAEETPADKPEKRKRK